MTEDDQTSGENAGHGAPQGPVVTVASVPPPELAAKRTPLWRKLLPFVIAAGLLGYQGWKMSAHFDAFADALSHLNYFTYMAYALGWAMLTCAGDTLGTVTVYRLTAPEVKYRQFYVMRTASYLPGIVNHHLGQAFLTYVMAKVFRVPLARMAGATLLSYVSWLGCLLGCMAIALPFTDQPKTMVPVILGAGILYLIVIGVRPAGLTKISFLAPLFEAGLKGHAVALATRFPHLCVLVLGAWGSFLFFPVHIPLATALVYMPLLLVAVTLPITPQGAGTRDTVAILFFLAFAEGATDGDKQAHIMAATVAWTISNTISCAILGLATTRMVTRQLEAARREDLALAKQDPGLVPLSP